MIAARVQHPAHVPKSHMFLAFAFIERLADA